MSFLQDLFSPTPQRPSLETLHGWIVAAIAEARKQDAERLDGIDKAIAEMQTQHSEDMRELRERLEMPAKRRSSGRPFQVLAKLAAAGAHKEKKDV